MMSNPLRFIIFVVLFFVPLFGADENDFVILPEKQIHQGDFFASGSTIEISGVVDGDVYAFGSHIVIDGNVTGSVIAFGGSIDVPGTILGNARLGGGQIDMQGIVGGNLTIFAGSFQIAPEAKIQGNAVITAGHLEVLGTIEGNATLSASNARIQGTIEKNVQAYVGTLRLGSLALIGGDLTYSSDAEAFIDSGAKIEGAINYQSSPLGDIIKRKWKHGFVVGGRIASLLMNFFFTFVSGWMLLKISRKKLDASIAAMIRSPWRAFWVGVLIMILLPIASLVLFITILGFPLAIALAALSLMGFYIAKVIPILWFGNTYLAKKWLKKDSLLTFAVALLLFFLVYRVPIVGRLISLVFTLLGLGAIFLGRVKKKSPQK